MGTTELVIKQNALILVGKTPIQSLEENTDKNAICQARYPILKKNLLSARPWNFVLRLVQLSQEANPPDGRFSFQYALPTDGVADGVVAAYTSGEAGAQTTVQFVIQGGKLLTNLDEIWVEYRKDIGEADFPDYFVDLICHSLASDIAMVLTDNERLMARIDGKASQMFRLAGRTDTQSSPPNNVPTNFPLVNARVAGVPT